MSVENVLSFWQRVQDDRSLQERLKVELKLDDREAALRRVVTVASEAGLSFTAEDYEAARRQIPSLLTAEGDDTAGHGAGRLVGVGGALTPGGVLRSGGILRAAGLGCASGLFRKPSK